MSHSKKVALILTLIISLCIGEARASMPQLFRGRIKEGMTEKEVKRVWGKADSTYEVSLSEYCWEYDDSFDTPKAMPNATQIDKTFVVFNKERVVGHVFTKYEYVSYKQMREGYLPEMNVMEMKLKRKD
jgi:hypothetical protein